MSEPDAPAHWLDQLRERIGLFTSLLLVGAVLVGLFVGQPALRWLSAVAALYLLVMLLTQNPHNLRHFAPVFFMGLLLTVVCSDLCGRWLARQSGLNAGRGAHLMSLVVFVVPLGVIGSSYLPTWLAAHRSSPILSAASYLDARAQTSTDHALGVNYQVNFLREQLPQLAIYDLYYPSQLFMLRNREHPMRWRLSTTELHDSFYRLEQEFPWRFPTERSLYLYRVAAPINGVIDSR